MEYGKFRLIDLFCGCGGMTEGFADTGRFTSVFANDFNHWAVESYNASFDPEGQHTQEGDIITIVEKKTQLMPKEDIVIGGPPSRIIS